VSVEALQQLARFRSDFPHFAKSCLQIRTKGEQTVPFVLNEAQTIIHERLEQQKREKGFVRALILKARQQGASTYIAARFYHRTSLHTNVNTYILSHEQASSDALFTIVDRYQRHNPFAPVVGSANVKELEFKKLDSSYQVATAGQKAGGRGRSVSLFHGSEVAFWTNAADHFASSVQAVPLMPNTEIVLESTANGIGGEFFKRWQKAEAGDGDYIAVFIPWFTSSEYSREPGPYFEISTEAPEGGMSEATLVELFGLTTAQLAWRRAKIEEIGEHLFKQEYPATAQEAFVSQGEGPYIEAEYVLRAQKCKPEAHGPLVLGVDPAGSGGDRFAICARRGYAVLWVKYRTHIDAEEGAAWVRGLIDELDPARVNIDNGGGGNGSAIISRLKALGPKFQEKIRAVNFGGTAEAKVANPKKPGPANRRAEMWMRMRDWLMDPVGASIPTMDDLPSDLSSVRKKPKPNGDFLLESKLDMKARQVRSPDLADAIALTFAQAEHILTYTEARNVATPYGDVDTTQQYEVQEYGGGEHGWMGLLCGFVVLSPTVLHLLRYVMA
jgi:hypothetical protein